MPEPAKIERAKLIPVKLGNGTAESKVLGPGMPVQFNPESLKVVYSNTIDGQNQAGGAAAQFVSKSSTKLSLDLWFDATAHETANDVRKLTQQVNVFMRPRPQKGKKKLVPFGARFLWGSFLFEGIVDSLNEDLEFFSADGTPLRARVSLSISAQEIQFEFGAEADNQRRGTPGTTPREQARAGDSLQGMKARAGSPKGWQKVGRELGIEDPLRLGTGDYVDLGAGEGRS